RITRWPLYTRAQHGIADDLGHRVTPLYGALLVIIALGIAAVLGYYAYTTYREEDGRLQWWQLLTPAFLGVGAISFFYAATAAPVLFTLLFVVRLGGLLALVVGGIIAIVQASSRPATSSASTLVAPIVGYTAQGEPVYGAPMRSQSTNILAILALVFGLLGGVLGVVFGHIALSQINRTGENGRGLAIAGLVLGYISVVAWIIVVIVAVEAATI
ncbi:DUF4190 domain-containing protein, partial [Rhodococcus pyridinivorans]|uniref:DUF4190 domain-containing protein n=1 Tax=Rhodococcus pyridinivorans TaxID=103816 RepID=UPI00341C2064